MDPARILTSELAISTPMVPTTIRWIHCLASVMERESTEVIFQRKSQDKGQGADGPDQRLGDGDPGVDQIDDGLDGVEVGVAGCGDQKNEHRWHLRGLVPASLRGPPGPRERRLLRLGQRRRAVPVLAQVAAGDRAHKAAALVGVRGLGHVEPVVAGMRALLPTAATAATAAVAVVAIARLRALGRFRTLGGLG